MEDLVWTVYLSDAVYAAVSGQLINKAGGVSRTNSNNKNIQHSGKQDPSCLAQMLLLLINVLLWTINQKSCELLVISSNSLFICRQNLVSGI